MTRDRRLRRDLTIALETLCGRSQREIAARHGICDRTVRRAIRRAQRMTENHSEEMLARLDEHWIELTASIEDLGLARLGARNYRTLVAAIGKQSELMHERSKILIARAQIDSARDQDETALAREFREQLLAAARRDGLDPGIRKWLAKETRRLAA